MSVSADKIYFAVKSGRVKIDDLNDESKQALHNYVATKNTAVTTQQPQTGQLPQITASQKWGGYDTPMDWADSTFLGKIIGGLGERADKTMLLDNEPAGQYLGKPMLSTGNNNVDTGMDIVGSVLGLMAPGPAGMAAPARGLLEAGNIANRARYLPKIGEVVAKAPAPVLDWGGAALEHGLPFASYGVGRGLAEDKSLPDAAKQGIIEGAAGMLGGVGGKLIKEALPQVTRSIVPQLTESTIPETISHYTGNIAKGGLTGAGMVYGQNLANDQPLQHGEATKNAAVFAALDAILGGRYRGTLPGGQPAAEPTPETVSRPKPERQAYDLGRLQELRNYAAQTGNAEAVQMLNKNIYEQSFANRHAEIPTSELVKTRNKALLDGQKGYAAELTKELARRGGAKHGAPEEMLPQKSDIPFDEARLQEMKAKLAALVEEPAPQNIETKPVEEPQGSTIRSNGPAPVRVYNANEPTLKDNVLYSSPEGKAMSAEQLRQQSLPTIPQNTEPNPYVKMLIDIRPDVEAEISKTYAPGHQPSSQQLERFVRDAAISKGYDYDALAKEAGVKPVEPQRMTKVEGTKRGQWATVQQTNSPKVKKAESEQYQVGQKLNTRPYGEVEIVDVGDILVKMRTKTGETPAIAKRSLRAILAKEQPKQFKKETPQSSIITDPAKAQEIKNSIIEGEMILKSGKNATGRKITPDELESVRRSIESAKVKIGEPKIEPLQDNYIKDISEYSPKIYRETNVDSALEFIPGANVFSDMKGEYYFANSADMAKGQGDNKGVLLEFDSKGIQGQVNTSKPGWEIAHQNGSTEFVAKHNNSKTYQDNLVSVTVQKGAKGLRIAKLKSALSGWGKVVNKDGSTTYMNPKKSSILSALDQMEVDVKASIKSKMSRVTSGVDPTLMADLAKYGAIKIAKGTVKFSQWASEMTKEFGTKIVPHLQKIYAQAKELHGRYINGNKEAIKIMGGTAGPKAEPAAKTEQTGTTTTAPPKVSIPYEGPLPDTKNVIKSKTENKVNIDTSYIKAKAEKEVTDNLNMLRIFDEYSIKTSGKKLSDKDKTYLLGLNSRNADVQTSFILHKGLIDAQGNEIGPGFKQITEQIPKGLDAEFKDYLIHKHAPSWLEQGRKIFADEYGITPDARGADISRSIAAKYEAEHPEFKEIADQIYDFQRKLAKAWLVDTGIINPKMFEEISKKYPNYIPLNRVIEPVSIFNHVKKGFVNQRNPIKEATGSERPIIDPIESIIEHIDMYVKTAKYNEVGQVVARQLEANPEALQGFAELTDTQANMNFKSIKEINKALREEGIDGLVEKYAQQFNEVFNKENRVRTKPGETVVTILKDGEPVHIKVNDPMFMEALSKLGPKGQTTILDALGRVTHTVKTLTTGINPIFGFFRNIFRDIPTAYVFSKSTNNPILFATDFLHSAVSILSEGISSSRVGGKLPDFAQSWLENMGKLYRSYQAAGGGHSSSISADRNLLAQSKRDIMGLGLDFKNRPVGSVKDIGKTFVGFLETLNNAVESAPRLGEYKRIAKDGDYANKVKGIYEAGDVTVNFKKHGDMIKQADNLVLYLNAAVQGLDKVARVFLTNNPYRKAAIMKGILGVTVPTIIAYALNHDNPNYQKLNNYTKDNYFLIPKPDGTFLKIPKPRELGVVFGSTTERLLRYWYENDPEAFKAFADTVLTNFMPPMRTIFAPFNDVARNKDFIGRPIVPGYMEKLSPELQYDSHTSEISKLLGQTFKMSPKKIEYLIRSYSGVLGQLGLPATTKGTGVSETLNRQITVDPLYSNDVMSGFYDTKQKLDTAHADFMANQTMSKDFNPGLQKFYTKQAEVISKISKQIRAIENSNLSPEEKKTRIDQLQELRLRVAGVANKINKGR